MTIEFKEQQLIIGGGDWSTAPLMFSKMLKVGGGTSPSWVDIILSGNGSLTLTNAKANGLNYVKLYGACEQSNLPSGYTQTIYTYFDTSAYLTTDFVPTYDGKVEFEFKTGSSIVNNATTYLGVRPASSGNGGLRVAHITSGVWRIYGFGSYADSTDLALPDTKYKFVYDNGHAVLTTGDTVVLDYTFTNTGENTYPVTINGWNSAGTVTAGAEPCYVYKLKGWDNQGELSIDYVPSTYNTSAGFYDNAINSFKTATSGTIVAGTTTPSPDYPMDIVCNNGVLKFGEPITIDNTRNYAYINTTGSWAWSSDSYSIALPVTVGKKYRIIISSTDSLIVGTIFRYGFTDSDPEEFKQLEVTPSPTSISIYDFWRGTPQDLSDVEVTATHPYMIIQFSAAYASTIVSNYLTVKYQDVYTDDTQEKVEVFGKNLFNSTPYKTGYYIDASGVEQPSATADEYIIRQAIVQPSTNYTISFVGTIGGYTQRIHAYDKSGNWIEQITALTSVVGDTTKQTITTPSNCKYVRQGGRSQADYQLELGSTATTYEPYYYGGSATAEPLYKVGTYQDVQSVLDGQVSRSVGVKVLDGTENWTRGTAIYANIPDLDAYFGVFTAMCTHFQAVSNSQQGSGLANTNKMCIGAPNVTGAEQYKNTVYIYGTTTDFPNVTAWTNWLKDQYNSGNPVIVIYPLATATTETVTGQTLTTKSGNNIIEITQASINNLPLEVSYKGTL